jgi:hypothetical protein
MVLCANFLGGLFHDPIGEFHVSDGLLVFVDSVGGNDNGMDCIEVKTSSCNNIRPSGVGITIWLGTSYNNAKPV